MQGASDREKSKDGVVRIGSMSPGCTEASSHSHVLDPDDGIIYRNDRIPPDVLTRMGKLVTSRVAPMDIRNIIKDDHACVLQ